MKKPIGTLIVVIQYAYYSYYIKKPVIINKFKFLRLTVYINERKY